MFTCVAFCKKNLLLQISAIFRFYFYPEIGAFACIKYLSIQVQGKHSGTIFGMPHDFLWRHLFCKGIKCGFDSLWGFVCLFVLISILSQISYYTTVIFYVKWKKYKPSNFFKTFFLSSFLFLILMLMSFFLSCSHFHFLSFLSLPLPFLCLPVWLSGCEVFLLCGKFFALHTEKQSSVVWIFVWLLYNHKLQDQNTSLKKAQIISLLLCNFL